MKTYKYKLVTQDYLTRRGEYNQTYWGNFGEWMPELGGGTKLCKPGFYHCYDHPLLAAIFNPAHADIDNPRCLLVEVGGKNIVETDKSGYTKMMPVREVGLPQVTLTQRIAFGILVAKEVYKDEAWNNWADKWLSGEDRSHDAADAYAAAAAAAADATTAAADAAAASKTLTHKQLLSIAKQAMMYQ